MLLVILNLGAISGLVWFFDVPYRQFRIDLLRHRLFGVRGALFIAARDGRISFSNPAYGLTRQTINGMIRFAHQVSFWQLLFMIATRRLWNIPAEQSRFSERFNQAKSDLTSDGKKVLDEVLNCAHGILIAHMAHTSLLLFPFALLLTMAARVFGALNLVVGTTDGSVPKPVLDWVDCQAYAVGEPEPLPNAA
jgi:hypothetical protein